jgi:hypothetical protein
MKPLKLGPLPTKETIRVSIAIPPFLKDVLERYTAEYGRIYEPVDMPTLIPHMLEAFIRSDRAFLKRQRISARALLNQPPTASESDTTLTQVPEREHSA